MSTLWVSKCKTKYFYGGFTIFGSTPGEDFKRAAHLFGHMGKLVKHKKLQGIDLIKRKISVLETITSEAVSKCSKLDRLDLIR